MTDEETTLRTYRCIRDKKMQFIVAVFFQINMTDVIFSSNLKLFFLLILAFSFVSVLNIIQFLLTKYFFTSNCFRDDLSVVRYHIDNCQLNSKTKIIAFFERIFLLYINKLVVYLAFFIANWNKKIVHFNSYCSELNYNFT